ncbi:hypothetical protein K3495_g421 [Podosphaera aphanis]|nr:hypothetical protein K3495_g421 [Podosphaera aphanis]
MRPIGCRAYALNRDLKKADKTASRSLIGHLLLEYPESHRENDISIEDLLTHRQRHCENEVSPATTETRLQVGGESTANREEKELEKKQFEDRPQDENAVDKNTALEPRRIPDGIRAYGEPAPQNINLNPHDTSLIVTGKRNRKQAPNPNVFAIQTHDMTLGRSSVLTYLQTFAAETPKQEFNSEVPKIHQSQLPPPLKQFKALEKQIFGEKFRQALMKEWTSLQKKGCFKRTKFTKTTADAEVLPLMWVFTYKISEEGYLASFKARLVIRGDLQEPSRKYLRCNSCDSKFSCSCIN